MNEKTATLHNAIRTSAVAYYAKRDDLTATQGEVKTLQTAMDNAVKAYNDHVLENVYSVLLATESPVAELCKRHAWNKTVVRNSKKDGITIVGYKTSLSVLDFLSYAEEKTADLKGADATAIRESLTTLTTELTTLMKKYLAYQQAPSKELDKAKSALKALLVACGDIEGVKRDMEIFFNNYQDDNRSMLYLANFAADIGDLKFMRRVYDLALRKDFTT
jgi:hypothetical protein